MVKIIMDHREDKKILKELIKHNIETDVKQLKVADFIIQSKDTNGNAIEIGIERKTNNDFLNSIIDKRIINQLIFLKKHFDTPLLIIEGEENIYEIRNFHPNSIRGMFASIAIDFQIPILYTRNHRDTAALLSIIAKRLERPIKPISLLQKRKPLNIKQQRELLVESLPGIGPTIAKSLLNDFKSLKNIFNASEEELLKIRKIGKKKAKELYILSNENY